MTLVPAICVRSIEDFLSLCAIEVKLQSQNLNMALTGMHTNSTTLSTLKAGSLAGDGKRYRSFQAVICQIQREGLLIGILEV